MRNPGHGSRRSSVLRVRPSPILFALAIGIGMIGGERPLCADNLLDRWRLFTPASVEKADTTPHPAVIRVVVDEGRLTANGSGSYVAARDQYGLVVTNWHVIRGAKGPIHVVFPDGFRSEATVLKTDQDWDLAALLIWRPQVEPLAIGTTAPQPGEPLTIAGYGSGDYRAVTGKCTQYLSPSIKHPYEILEVSAAARQGDSGGPILNERGELAGVLFGADRRTTSGSYCGRVRWFLTSVWPELDATTVASAANSAGATPLASTPSLAAASPVLSFPSPEDHSAAVTDPLGQLNLQPIQGADQFARAPSSADALSELEMSTPYTTLAPLPDPSRQSVLDWQRWLGTTRFDQAKSVLAALGLLALWRVLSRWMVG